eukprot:14487305-Alexandrium_andersonii.AAC.1
MLVECESGTSGIVGADMIADSEPFAPVSPKGVPAGRAGRRGQCRTAPAPSLAPCPAPSSSCAGPFSGGISPVAPHLTSHRCASDASMAACLDYLPAPPA